MKIQCDCGDFQATLTHSPKNSPGRLVCYCDDCQAFAETLGRTDVLDEFGGTQVVPVYPGEISFVKGEDTLCYSRMSEDGLFSIFNDLLQFTDSQHSPELPLAGVFHSAYTAADPKALDEFGDIRGRIMGKYARGNPGFKIADKIGMRDMLAVLPFVLKGKILGKHKTSPFFEGDGVTPVGSRRG